MANSASAKRYDASEWSLTEADSMRLAKIFAKYEDESEKLDVGRLRALAAECVAPSHLICLFISFLRLKKI